MKKNVAEWRLKDKWWPLKVWETGEKNTREEMKEKSKEY